MGMFDDIRCRLPLPVEVGVDHREHWFQTKSLDCELDRYEISFDGTLWHESYDTEDQSDPNATGLLALCGIAAKVNRRWVAMPEFIGEIVFYSFASELDGSETQLGWVELSAYFVHGKIKHFELLNYEAAK